MTIDKIMEYISSNPRSVNKTIIKGMIEELIKENEPKQPEIEMKELMVNKNGVFRAPEGKAYNKIIVNVKEEKKNE